jgi:hypothetical protein
VAGSGVRLTGDWDRFRTILSPGRFTRDLERHVGRATHKNALLLRREIRRQIRSGIQPGKSPLAAALARGGTKTLVGRSGELFKAVAAVSLSWDKAFAGVMRRGHRKRGVALFNIATTLHEGATIPVTDDMRNLFAALFWARIKGDPSILRSPRARELWDAAPGFEWRRLSPGKKNIRITGRPFVKNAMRAPGLRAAVLKNWSDAVDETFRGGNK